VSAGRKRGRLGVGDINIRKADKPWSLPVMDSLRDGANHENKECKNKSKTSSKQPKNAHIRQKEPGTEYRQEKIRLRP